MLKGIVETGKSVIPATIKFQDRGKMIFPHKALMPFMRKCSTDQRVGTQRSRSN